MGNVYDLKVAHAAQGFAQVRVSKPWFESKEFKANPSNTLLINSIPLSSVLNPFYNDIFPSEYIGDLRDCVLQFSLAPYLKCLVQLGRSVTQFVSENPLDFGVTNPPKQLVGYIIAWVCAPT